MTDLDMQLARLGVKVAKNTPDISKARIIAAVQYMRATAMPSLGHELARGLRTLRLSCERRPSRPARPTRRTNTLLSAVDRINERMFGVKPTEQKDG